MRAITGFLSIALVAAPSAPAVQIAPVPPPLAPKTVKRPVVANPTAMPPFAPLAVTYVYNAVPQSAPPDRLGTVPVSVNWVCDQAGCKTIAAWPQPVVAGCTALARQIGPIASYGRSGSMLSAAQLNQCNRGIPGAAMLPVPSSASPSNAGQTAQDSSGPVSNSSPTQPSTEGQSGSGQSGSDATAPATASDANSGTPATGSTTTTTVTSTDASVVPAAVSTSADSGAASAPSSASSTPGVATGVQIIVGEFAVVGGIQRTVDATLGELTVSAGELTVVGGAQGSRPTEPPPLSIRVPELMISGR